ncbi:MAG: DsrE family protein [Planctomyces sp.]|nr:DsrE family protein [Planctomyces sp.]
MKTRISTGISLFILALQSLFITNSGFAMSPLSDEKSDLNTGVNAQASESSSVTPQIDVTAQVRPGRGAGRGMGRGRGPDASMRADQDVFHYLLEHHEKIRREVKNLDNGVQTLTESDDAAVAAKIQEHVSAMHARVRAGRGLRFWDELFTAIFDKYEKIEMIVENTDKGVRVTETSSDPWVVRLIQAHATVVSKFVERGFEEAHENHPVPSKSDAASEQSSTVDQANLQYPIVTGFGGVAVVSGASESPRAGMKVVFDVTAAPQTDSEVNRGLDRVARLLNLYGISGMKASDVQITVVLHGEATRSVLTNQAWATRYETSENPNLLLIESLNTAGVEIIVCGQALNSKTIRRDEVSGNVSVAVAAMTVLLNRQADGYTSIQIP